MRVALSAVSLTFSALVGCGGSTAGSPSVDGGSRDTSSRDARGLPDASEDAHATSVVDAATDAGALGAPCDAGGLLEGGSTCPPGLTCNVNGSQSSGNRAGGVPLRCLAPAGAHCVGPGTCLSDLCTNGACALSPAGYSCGSTSDCEPDAGYGGTTRSTCTPIGECCPVKTGGGPPGCPGA